METSNWNMVLTEAKLLAYTDEQIIKLCRELSGKKYIVYMYIVNVKVIVEYSDSCIRLCFRY